MYIKNGWKAALEKVVQSRGTKGPSATVVVKENVGAAQELVITLSNERIATVDAGANGAQGSLKLYTFPQCDLTILGATANLVVTKEGAGIANNATVLSAVGTTQVAAGEATLSGTEADYTPSTSTVLASGTGTAKNRLAAVAKFDGTTTAKDVWLNLNVDATGSTANDAVLVSGTIRIAYVNCGDY